MVQVDGKTGVWQQYEVEGGKLKRNNKFSPKTNGTFMAEHKDRRTCGRTGYTEFKKD